MHREGSVDFVLAAPRFGWARFCFSVPRHQPATKALTAALLLLASRYFCSQNKTKTRRLLQPLQLQLRTQITLHNFFKMAGQHTQIASRAFSNRCPITAPEALLQPSQHVCVCGGKLGEGIALWV